MSGKRGSEGDETCMFSPPKFAFTRRDVLYLPGKVPEGGDPADERASSGNGTIRRPTELNPTNCAGEEGKYSPVPSPYYPSLEVQLQNVKGEQR